MSTPCPSCGGPKAKRNHICFACDTPSDIVHMNHDGTLTYIFWEHRRVYKRPAGYTVPKYEPRRFHE